MTIPAESSVSLRISYVPGSSTTADLSSDSTQLSYSNNSTLDSISSTGDSGVCMTQREVASHGESTSYDIVDEKRKDNNNANKIPELPVSISPTKKTIAQRSSARRHHRSNSANLYDLSVDLREKTIQCLENKYGGKEMANEAARQIQLCYRHWVISRSFLRMRAFSGRKRSITMPEKHFEKLKKTTLVFYGPDNPVMIVDGEDERRSPSPKIRHKSESDLSDIRPTVTLAELVNYPSLQLDSHDDTSTDSEELGDGEKKEDDVRDGLIENHFEKPTVPEEKVCYFVTLGLNIREEISMEEIFLSIELHSLNLYSKISPP